MQHTYKILSLLLDYPDREVKVNLPEMMEAVEEERYLSQAQAANLRHFLDYALSIPLTEWQTQYVQLFDLTASSNLYLFDHVYGDSRERGQAMVDLIDMYRKSGFTVRPDELPDYLPLFLEYISLLNSPADAGVLLTEISHVLEQMKQTLEKKNSPYHYLLDILYSLSGSETTGVNEKI
jgi:nitrate reductase delta subunit